MSLPIPPHPHNSPSTQTLEEILTAQFQQRISQHSTLKIDQIFYLEASRLYLQLLQKLQAVRSIEMEIKQLREKQGFETQRKRILNSSQSVHQNGSDRKKRERRTAEEIARHYLCTIDNCNRSYGSQGSLNQHIKIKHGGRYNKHLLIKLGSSNFQ